MFKEGIYVLNDNLSIQNFQKSCLSIYKLISVYKWKLDGKLKSDKSE